MDSFEATSLVFAKIKNLDPDNASKIMGYLLIQDLGEKDLVRLALSPEFVLHSLILKAKTHLGISSNTSSTPPSPSPLNPIARPTSSSNPFSQSSPRIPSNGFDFSKIPSSPSSSNSWSLSGFRNNPISPKSSPLLSYDNIQSGSFAMPQILQSKNGNNGDDFGTNTEAIDEHQLNQYLSLINKPSFSSFNEDFMDPRPEMGHGVQNWAHSVSNGDPHFHRRSYSASDVCFGSDDGGFKPCLYFARGFCKNGGNCKFIHSGFPDSMDASAASIGSPSKFDGVAEMREELMRLKVSQQQRFAAATQYNKFMSFNPQRAAAAAAFMMGEEFHKFLPCRNERNDFLSMAGAEKRNSASRQIYLTFPADSTFKDEDVSEYFSKFGPVQDVRIPYQQKRMFGFVTFVYPETVKLILAKGNPHFICDSRVLVKPYKEKGKVPDKRHQQLQQEMGEFSPCMSPSGLDARDPFDLHLGARMSYSTQDMLLRRKLEEQAELHQAIELHGRRLMNLHLPDMNDRIHHHQHNLSVGSPFPTESHSEFNQNPVISSDCVNNHESAEGLDENRATNFSITSQQQILRDVNPIFIHSNNTVKKEEESSECEHLDIRRSLEQALPDNLFASPRKSDMDNQHTDFSSAVAGDSVLQNKLSSLTDFGSNIASI